MSFGTLRRAASIATAAFATIAQVAWSPLDGPQTDAVETPAMVTGYGGQAGGGKSDTLLGIPLSFHQASIIYRREYPQLRGLVRRSREIIGKQGRYNGAEHTWNLKDGRTLEFASVPHEDSVSKYQGQPHDYIGFDEVQHFAQSQVRFLLGWLRSAVPNQRVRCVMTFNPPTSVEGQWIVDYFGPWLDPKHERPASPGEVRWFAMLDGVETDLHPVTGKLLSGEPFEHDGETIRPTSRTFIRAALSDNPYLENSGYRATLQALPEPLRSQMLKGDFLAGIEDDAWQVIPTRWVQAAMERGKTQPTRPVDGAGKPLLLTALGGDIAAGGLDKTVFAPVYGGYWFAPLISCPGAQTPDGATAAAKLVEAMGTAQTGFDAGGENIAPNIDVIGIGQGLLTALTMLGIKFNGVNVATGSYYRDKSGLLKMANKRAEVYWKMREALDPEGGRQICLPDDRELLADLCAARWSLTSAGVQIEAKDDGSKNCIKGRLGRSPDKGEAVMLANYVAPVAGFV